MDRTLIRVSSFFGSSSRQSWGQSWGLSWGLLLGLSFLSALNPVFLLAQVNLQHFERAKALYRQGKVGLARKAYARAAQLPSGLDPLQRRVLKRINYHREKAMLVPVMASEKVARAARSHARYLDLHAPEGILTLSQAHRENPSKKGFTGRGPGDRIARQGFYGGSTEVVTAVTEAEEAVDHLVNTVYHRGGILRPEARYAGVGVGSRTVIDLAWGASAKAENDCFFYPGNWQQDVPPRFPGGETPNPLPNEEYPVGVPISIGSSPSPPKLLEAYLQSPLGRKVSYRLLHRKNAPAGDMLGNYIYLIPEQGLKANTRYSAYFKVMTEGGERERHWAFRTGEAVPGESLWRVEIKELQRSPRQFTVGEKVTFEAKLQASHPDEVTLRWMVNDEVVQRGESRRFEWIVAEEGTHLIDVLAFYPEQEGAYGRRALEVSLGGSTGSSLPPSTNKAGLGDGLSLELGFEPNPPWKKGTKVRLQARAKGVEAKESYHFFCDGEIISKGSSPRATWISDGEIAHDFVVELHHAEGRVRRRVSFRSR